MGTLSWEVMMSMQSAENQRRMTWMGSLLSAVFSAYLEQKNQILAHQRHLELASSVTLWTQDRADQNLRTLVGKTLTQMGSLNTSARDLLSRCKKNEQHGQ
jgi:hypothetical protein